MTDNRTTIRTKNVTRQAEANLAGGETLKGPHLAGTSFGEATARNEDSPSFDGIHLQLGFFSLLARVALCSTLKEGSQQLAIGLQDLTGANEVVIGSCAVQGKLCKVQAISRLPQFDSKSGRLLALRAALNEAIMRGELCHWPAADDEKRHCLQAHRRVSDESGGEGILSVPLKDENGKCVAVCLFTGISESTTEARCRLIAQTTGPHVAATLSLLKRAEGGTILRTSRRIGSKLAGYRAALWMMSVAFVIAAGFLPWTHRIACDCVVEPTARRFVAAPFETALNECLVKQGAVVKKGELIARLDGRELRWELAAAQAEIEAATKKHDTELADRNAAAARLTRLEIEKLQLKQALLKRRLSQLDIRSPVDGVVISGDLERAEGVRLSIGQNLFEIAPLDSMILELNVPQSEIAYVEAGIPIEARLESVAGRKLKGSVSRIHPQSELREHENVFIAEVLLDNADGSLRPGMQGQAKLVGGQRSLGWIYLHKPWEQFQLTWGW